MAEKLIVVAWGEDSVAESKMRSMGVTYKMVRSVHIEEIDVAASRRNNARLMDPYEDALAHEYADAMAAGDRFPAIIIVKRGGRKTNKYMVLSGNHRLGAAIDCEQEVVDAYILDDWDEKANDIIARSANRWTGKRQERDEALEHARFLIETYKLTVPAVAPLLSLKVSWLSAALRAEQIRSGLVDLNVRGVENLPHVSLHKLNKLKGSKDVMAVAAEIAVSRGLTSERIVTMVESVAKQSNDDKKLTALAKMDDTFVSEDGVKAPRAVVTPYRTRFLKALNNLHSIVCLGNSGEPFDNLKQLQITSSDDRAMVKRRMKEMCDRLSKITGVKIGG